jgi:predicted nucleotidyltransferase component of viral defense system
LQISDSRFSIDVAAGDPVTPSAVDYAYECLLTAEEVKIKAYPLETVIAEKFETVLCRGLTNSRAKDFYDLCILSKTNLFGSETKFLKVAFRETCQHRHFDIDRAAATILVKELERSEMLNRRWVYYVKKSKYASGLEWSDIIKTLESLLALIFE